MLVLVHMFSCVYKYFNNQATGPGQGLVNWQKQMDSDRDHSLGPEMFRNRFRKRSRSWSWDVVWSRCRKTSILVDRLITLSTDCLICCIGYISNVSILQITFPLCFNVRYSQIQLRNWRGAILGFILQTTQYFLLFATQIFALSEVCANKIYVCL